MAKVLGNISCNVAKLDAEMKIKLPGAWFKRRSRVELDGQHALIVFRHPSKPDNILMEAGLKETMVFLEPFGLRLEIWPTSNSRVISTDPKAREWMASSHLDVFGNIEPAIVKMYCDQTVAQQWQKEISKLLGEDEDGGDDVDEQYFRALQEYREKGLADGKLEQSGLKGMVNPVDWTKSEFDDPHLRDLLARSVAKANKTYTMMKPLYYNYGVENVSKDPLKRGEPAPVEKPTWWQTLLYAHLSSEAYENKINLVIKPKGYFAEQAQKDEASAENSDGSKPAPPPVTPNYNQAKVLQEMEYPLEEFVPASKQRSLGVANWDELFDKYDVDVELVGHEGAFLTHEISKDLGPGDVVDYELPTTGDLKLDPFRFEVVTVLKNNRFLKQEDLMDALKALPPYLYVLRERKLPSQLQGEQSAEYEPGLLLVIRGTASPADIMFDLLGVPASYPPFVNPYITLDDQDFQAMRKWQPVEKDFSTVPLPFEKYGQSDHFLQIHGGNVGAAVFLYERLRSDFHWLSALRQYGSDFANIPIRITGHSLGGATATLLGYILMRDGFNNVRQIVTFGAPMSAGSNKVLNYSATVPGSGTNFRSAELMSKYMPQVFRYANEQDFVPNFPGGFTVNSLNMDFTFDQFGAYLMLSASKIYEAMRAKAGDNTVSLMPKVVKVGEGSNEDNNQSVLSRVFNEGGKLLSYHSIDAARTGYIALLVGLASAVDVTDGSYAWWESPFDATDAVGASHVATSNPVKVTERQVRDAAKVLQRKKK